MAGAGSERQRTLLERSAELGAIEEALDELAAGSSRPLAVEGAAGIGKTSLMLVLRERARERGFSVLHTSGGELEADHPYGLVRELFASLVHGATGSDRQRLLAGVARPVEDLLEGAELAPREDRAGDPSHAILHGLTSLLRNHAQDGPALVAVDDAHWGDRPSLRWLSYVARRLGTGPFALLAVSLRPPSDEAAALLDPLVSNPAARRIELRPLSAEASSQLVAAAFAKADPAFTSACHSVTAGNPFYLSVLLDALGDRRVAPRAENVDRVLALGPTAVAKSTLARIRALPRGALALARAVAVLGTEVPLRHAAAVAGLAELEASAVAEALAKAGILNDAWPLDFVHPIVRSAIRSDMSAIAAGQMHAKAARVLADDQVDVDRIAAHLLASPPAGDPWVVDSLSRAAVRASARGASDSAARYLARALDEPAPEGARRDVLLALGTAEARSGGDPIAHLEAALELTKDPVERGSVASALGGCLVMAGRAADAVRLLDAAISDLPRDAREPGLRLETDISVAAFAALEAWQIATARQPRFDGDPERLETPGDRLTAVARATELALRGGDGASAVSLIVRALDGGFSRDVGSDAPAFYLAVSTLVHAGAIRETERALEEALKDAEAQGSIRGYGMVTAWLAETRYRAGQLRAAEADARESLITHAQLGMVVGVPIATSFLVESLVDQGRLAEAEATLAPLMLLTGGDTLLHDYIRHAAARLRFAQHRIEEGVELLLAIGRNTELWNAPTPFVAPWRSSVAPALATLGREASAHALVQEDLEIARRYGSRPALGQALRAAGVLASPNGLALLRESVDVLTGSGAELERARSLIEFGAALRRAGDRREARKPLLEGLDICHQCGAAPLAERARGEAVAAGAKPRRSALRGYDALTQSELRVARLAASGMTNREIAAELVVTRKTVEAHLRSVYRKLSIASREALTEALPAEAAAPQGHDGTDDLPGELSGVEHPR